jgi:tRNA-dihydrouridine synthase B
VQDHGADFVDLNLGCPVKKVVCDGAGAAWLKEPVKLGKVLTAMKQALRVPLTIKIRTGWDEESRNPLEIVKVAADAGVSWVAIHGRTRAQGYSGLADWELIREVAIHSPLPIIGNGDILTSGQSKRRIEQGYAHGVMIGRGALKNPWIFKEILSPEKVNYDFVKLVEDHIELALAHKERRRAFLSLKKFLAWYATGYRNASHFRAALFKTEDLDELRVIARDFFVETKFKPVDDGQPFLMGGHG